MNSIWLRPLLTDIRPNRLSTACVTALSPRALVMSGRLLIGSGGGVRVRISVVSLHLTTCVAEYYVTTLTLV